MGKGVQLHAISSVWEGKASLLLAFYVQATAMAILRRLVENENVTLRYRRRFFCLNIAFVSRVISNIEVSSRKTA